AVGISIRDVVHAIALDQKRILPVASLVNGPYGIRDVCISVPTVVGRKGVESQLEIALWPKEVSALARDHLRPGRQGTMMEKSLDRKLAAIHADPNCREFILADAKDADMAFGI